jgi:hypothetical protein
MQVTNASSIWVDPLGDEGIDDVRDGVCRELLVPEGVENGDTELVLRLDGGV